VIHGVPENDSQRVAMSKKTEDAIMQPYSNNNINTILNNYKYNRVNFNKKLNLTLFIFLYLPMIIFTLLQPGIWIITLPFCLFIFIMILYADFVRMDNINKQLKAWLQFSNQANLTLMMVTNVRMWINPFIYGIIQGRDILLKTFRHHTIRKDSTEIVTRLSITIRKKVEPEIILFHEYSKRQVIEWEHVCGVDFNVVHIGTDNKHNKYYLASNDTFQVNDTFQDFDFNILKNLRSWRFRWHGNSAIADRFDVEYNSDNLIDVMNILLSICERLEHNLNNSLNDNVLEID